MGRERTRFQGVYQRASTTKRWNGKPDVCYDISYKDASGRKVWEKVGWTSEKYTAAMASQIRAERIQAIRHGDLPHVIERGKPEITLGEAWRRYDADWITPNIKRPENDRSLWKCHLEEQFSRLPLSSIDTLALERLRTKLRAKELSPQSVHHCLALIRRVINKAIDWKLWRGENPVSGINLPTVDNKRYRFLSKEEADLLLNEIRRRSEDTWHICLTALHTGMRLGEINSLRWEHINFEAGTAQVLESKTGVGRAVMLTPTLQDALLGLAKTRGEGLKPGLVFPDKGGKLRKKLSYTFIRAVRALGFNEGITDRRGLVVFHTLRHTFASWLAMAGVTLYQLAEMLGHKSIKMVMRYAHLCPTGARKASNEIERLFGTSAHRRSGPGGPRNTP